MLTSGSVGVHSVRIHRCAARIEWHAVGRAGWIVSMVTMGTHMAVMWRVMMWRMMAVMRRVAVDVRVVWHS
jgi:hypothetical protein